MPPTIRDTDTVHLCGTGVAVQIGHFYVDVSRRRLHSLNDQARHLRQVGVPLLESDPALAEMRTAEGSAVTPDVWPMTQAARNGCPVEADLILVRPGKSPQRLHYSVTPMKDGGGRITALLASIACLPSGPDWSLVAGLAHDLRTPLQSLATLKHILDFRTLPEAQRQDALDRMAHAADRAQKIAQELLEWCRTRGTARHASRFDWMALEPLVREIVGEQTAAARQKHLTLEMKLDAIRGWQVHTDRGKLARVIANLLVNAIRYTPAGGRVVVGADWQDQEDGRMLVLEVRDTGAGISVEEQESIFNAFERGQSGRDSDAPGSGVGLSVVDRLTQELGLACDMHSVAGQGSEFRIQVPQSLLRMAPTVS
jgi:nitrogen-specific signal transduction histidine kinase